MMTMFDWMLDGGTHSRLDVMNSKMDALIEGQKETMTSLKESQKEDERQRCKEINDNLKGETERNPTRHFKKYVIKGLEKCETA